MAANAAAPIATTIVATSIAARSIGRGQRRAQAASPLGASTVATAASHAINCKVMIPPSPDGPRPPDISPFFPVERPARSRDGGRMKKYLFTELLLAVVACLVAGGLAFGTVAMFNGALAPVSEMLAMP